jgi:hypothetical protein
MREQAVRAVGAGADQRPSPRARAFFNIWLPLGIMANLGLGLLVLADIGANKPWTDWLQLGTGAFCCMVAGWLSAALWSRVYWNRSMARQVAVWRRIADTFFAWVEEVPLPAETLHRLETSLDEVVATPEVNQGVS